MCCRSDNAGSDDRCPRLRTLCNRVCAFCSKMAASATADSGPATQSQPERPRSPSSSPAPPVGGSPTKFCQAFAAESLASLLLVLIGCGSWIEFHVDRDPDVVRIAATFAATYAGLVYAIRHISGGHVNPCVTLAWLAARKISIGRAVTYIVGQVLGAIVGAALLIGLTPSHFQVNLGATVLNVSPEQGFAVELFATFAVTFTALAAQDKPREGQRVAAPFVIGLVMLGAELFAVPFTGGSLNPARSFGPAIIKWVWRDHWVFWFGPVIGGVAGGLVYDYIFATTTSFSRVRACVTANEKRHPSSRAEVGEPPEQIALSTHHGSSSLEEINLAEEGKVGKVITPDESHITDV